MLDTTKKNESPTVEDEALKNQTVENEGETELDPSYQVIRQYLDTLLNQPHKTDRSAVNTYGEKISDEPTSLKCLSNTEVVNRIPASSLISDELNNPVLQEQYKQPQIDDEPEEVQTQNSGVTQLISVMDKDALFWWHSQGLLTEIELRHLFFEYFLSCLNLSFYCGTGRLHKMLVSECRLAGLQLNNLGLKWISTVVSSSTDRSSSTAYSESHSPQTQHVTIDGAA